jgi:hypothetical protein
MTGRLPADHPFAALYAGIDRYYSHKVKLHGATPAGRGLAVRAHAGAAL